MTTNSQGRLPITGFREERLRAGRRRALRSIRAMVVIAVDDGHELRELAFDEAPTLGALCERLGVDTHLVGIRTERRRNSASVRPDLTLLRG
ncbi:MAG: hypothetical protein ACOY5U_12825 [Pseudomonadota bacterium]